VKLNCSLNFFWMVGQWKISRRQDSAQEFQADCFGRLEAQVKGSEIEHDNAQFLNPAHSRNLHPRPLQGCTRKALQTTAHLPQSLVLK